MMHAHTPEPLVALDAGVVLDVEEVLVHTTDGMQWRFKPDETILGPGGMELSPRQLPDLLIHPEFYFDSDAPVTKEPSSEWEEEGPTKLARVRIFARGVAYCSLISSHEVAQ